MASIVSMPKVGDVVGGQYQVVREIGRGGFGVVFEARQMGLERKVAIKMLRPRAVGRKGVSERFEREARLASSLRHPNSVKIFTFGVYGASDDVRGLPFIAMEYLEGQDLQAYLQRRGTMSPVMAADVLQQALSSLAEAHERGIVHRDLKPENLFITANHTTVKVLDFGIARAVAGDEWGRKTLLRLTADGMVTGTPEYMAPEQATGEPNLTPAVDVYASACLGYKMCTGRTPYSGRTPLETAHKHVSEPVPVFPEPLASSFLAPVLERAMEKDPADRYGDAGAFRHALMAAAASAGYDISHDRIRDASTPSAANPTDSSGAIEPVAAPSVTDPEDPQYSGPTVMMSSAGPRREIATDEHVPTQREIPHVDKSAGGQNIEAEHHETRDIPRNEQKPPSGGIGKVVLFVLLFVAFITLGLLLVGAAIYVTVTGMAPW